MPHSRANGVSIHYEVSGEGPPLVLLHANPFDHHLWMYQIAHLSTWFRVIAVDIRGYGRSEAVTAEFTLTDLCDDAIGVLRDEGAERVILLGCSVGAKIAILLGLDHPELIAALILVGGNSGASSRYRQRIYGHTGTGLGAYHIRHMKELVCADFAEREPRLSGEAIAQMFRAANATDATPRLGTMKAPTLVINGEHDHSLPAGRRTAALIPGASHKILPGTGHACCIEDPAGFDALVIAFLEDRGLMPPLET